MKTNLLPRIRTRSFQTEQDWYSVRNLLIETFPIAGPEFNWEIRHWDGNRYHREGPDWQPDLYKNFRIWETEEGRLVGMVHPDGTGDAYFQLHPDFRLIEEEMVAWAEENLSAPGEGGRRELVICVFEYDEPRRRLLEQRGFKKCSDGWILRRLRFEGLQIPEPVIADGYRMRTTRPGDESDCQRIADVLNAGFNRPNFHTALEYHNFSTHSPTFCHDLNLVAEAADGSFAAHVGITLDEVNRIGIYEPVCTHPDHRRKGLAQALMFEGLRRLKAMGAIWASVATGDMIPANALYESIGFSEAYKAYNWRKVF